MIKIFYQAINLAIKSSYTNSNYLLGADYSSVFHLSPMPITQLNKLRGFF